MNYLPKQNGLIFSTNCGKSSVIIAKCTDIDVIQMMYIHLILLLLVLLNGIFKQSQTPHLVSRNDAFIHDKCKLQKLIIFRIKIRYLFNSRTCLLEIFIPLRRIFKCSTVHFLLIHKINNYLLFLFTLKQYIIMINTKIKLRNLNMIWDLDLILQVKLLLRRDG